MAEISASCSKWENEFDSRKLTLSNAIIQSVEKYCCSKVSTIFVFMLYFECDKLLRKEGGQEEEHFIDFNEQMY